MLEILQFVFSGFWTFVGCALLLGIVVKGIIGVIAVLFAKGNVNIT